VPAMKLKRGDTWTISGSLKDAAGDPVSLAGCSLRMQIQSLRDFDGIRHEASTSDGSISVNDPASGEFTVIFSAGYTESITPGRYVTDVEITWQDASITSSETWEITVYPDVTRD